MKREQLDQPWFIFDVESIGLHGEAFAVGGGIYINGVAKEEFCFSCPREEAEGRDKDREWVEENIQEIKVTHPYPHAVYEAFWTHWCDAKVKYPEIKMIAECLWPVEARFVLKCIENDPIIRNWDGPYPFHDVASFMEAAGMDSMASYDREDSEKPAHNPLADARLSARLLHEAMKRLYAGF